MKYFLSALLAICLLTGFVSIRPAAGIGTVNQTVSLSDTLKKDPETGLYEDKNLYMVKAQCTNCHSTKLIQQHRFTRDGWKQKIRWMQANHNLWNLGETEVQVLDYLEKYYAPSSTIARRAPLKDIKWYKLNP
ncbi:hypothetical protein DYBT9275_00328 [Dyadobacter sp. CECT 9275]|uniref:Uncharacterized protein n=1 Tax=Dyadobacter helix TaxID=2822344 RepID=A0A916J859_9BACT|nr:hypothetical protein [Dyadobacter sp. CECT 9275]CAG4989618.1 hypothetical protein DYBT9275_00328 [Dyadobacter sp. CECT 9275]